MTTQDLIFTSMFLTEGSSNVTDWYNIHLSKRPQVRNRHFCWLTLSCLLSQVWFLSCFSLSQSAADFLLLTNSTRWITYKWSDSLLHLLQSQHSTPVPLGNSSHFHICSHTCAFGWAQISTFQAVHLSQMINCNIQTVQQSMGLLQEFFTVLAVPRESFHLPPVCNDCRTSA